MLRGISQLTTFGGAVAAKLQSAPGADNPRGIRTTESENKILRNCYVL